MTYPKFEPGKSECAHCQKDIGGDNFSNSYLTVRDNFMIVTFFQFEGGQDNIFCDSDCLANYLSAETIYLEDNDESME